MRLILFRREWGVSDEIAVQSRAKSEHESPLSRRSAMLSACACGATLPLTLLVLAAARAQPCADHESELLYADADADGRVLFGGVAYPRGTWWRPPDEQEGVLRGCPCVLRPCLRKCCVEEQQLTLDDEGQFACTDLGNYSAPFFPGRRFHVLFGLPEPCAPVPLEDAFSFNVDGSLVHGTRRVSHNGYCVDRLNGSDAPVAFVCDPEEDDDVAFHLYPVGMIVSLPCLAATFLVYAFVPRLRNLHGRCLVCHTGSLFVAYLFLAVVHLAKDNLGYGACVAAAFVVYFTILATFCWLNSMCIDLWLGFRHVQKSQISIDINERKRFLIYSAYSWGLPTVLFSFTATMQFLPEMANYIITPGIGERKCWFEDCSSASLYFFIPITIITLSNIILFIMTARRIIHFRTGSKVLRNKEDMNNNETIKQRFSVYMKLFFAMGITWIMEVISWFVKGPEYMWWVTDFMNTLQGLSIFSIFVLNKRVLKIIKKNFLSNL